MNYLKGMFGEHRFTKASISVELHHSTIDMVGSGSVDINYSLPGIVKVTLPSLPQSLASQVRVLKDVTVVVEGKSEYFDDTVRYKPIRLFTSTLPLVHQQRPVPIPATSPDGSLEVTVAMPFDLRIPAWVPQSAVISWTATMYGVMATAAVGWAHGGGKQHTAVSKYVPFIVKRHRMPTAVEPSVNIPPREYWREAYSTQLDKVVSFCLGVPEWVDVHGETLVCRFRMRIRGLGSKNEVTEVADTDDPAATLIAALQSGTNAVQGATRLGASSGSGSTKDSKYLTFLRDICIEVEETVKCHSNMSSSFRHYPMPEEQPHPFSKNYRLIGPSFRPDPFSICLPFEQAHAVMSKTMCLLADDGSQRHHVLPNGGKGVGRAACSFNIITPMPEVNSACDKTRPHPDSETPFMRVAHKLNIHVKIQAPGFAEPETLSMSVPIKFATSPLTYPTNTAGTAQAPPYISLFHDNGEPRDCDPLPLYPGLPVPVPVPTAVALPPTVGLNPDAMEVDGTLAELSESQSEPSTPPDADVAMADEDGYETGESTDADGDAVTEMEQALAEALGLALRPTSAASSSDAPSVGSSEHAPKPVASDEGKPHSHSHPGSSASSSVPSPQAPAAKLPAVPPFQWTFMSHSI